jgi:hypothetical protein
MSHDRSEHRNEELDAYFSVTGFCVGCEERHDREDMVQCEHCTEWTCIGCHKDGERHGTRYCSHCGNAPIPPDLT